MRAFHGFGGLHGGLTTALLLRAMRSAAARALRPVEVTAHLVRPITESPQLDTAIAHTGRALTLASAAATSGERPAAHATAVLAAPLDPRAPGGPAAWAEPRPTDVRPVANAERFAIPPELVPIATRFEIRPATARLPFSAADAPELCAWIRLTDPVEDPWERLLVLADALAPSYAAVLAAPRPVPTVRTSVRFVPEAATTVFDWVLVRATTTHAGADGWLTETIHVWSPDGTTLATASQLRLLV
ncbi:UNVERIFIED_CONTAM: hypothetical protein LK11_54815 [Mumia flava]